MEEMGGRRSVRRKERSGRKEEGGEGGRGKMGESERIKGREKSKTIKYVIHVHIRT